MEKTGTELFVLGLSVSAVDVLQGVGESELYLHGDPSGQLPLFLLQWQLRRRVRSSVKPVEPRAHYCAELLEHGVIEPRTAGAESGDRLFQISEKGRTLLLDLDRRKGSI